MAGVTNNRVPMLGRKAGSPPPLDWRKNCPGVNGKLQHLLSKGLMTDVTFRVGSQTEREEVEVIQAHKFMLAMFSSVFEAMFMGRFLENGTSSEDVIELPDIQPLAFWTLLRFIYIGELDKNLSTCDVLATLYAAKKYDISELEVECTQYLKKHLSEENAVSIFQAAQLFDEKELKDEALAFLKRNFDNVMHKEDFLSMSMDNLCLFLRDNGTFASELSIFQGALRWADTECSRQGIIASPENQRKVIKDALQLIRFPVISSEDIALEVIPTRVLTPEECTLLLQYKVVNPENRNPCELVGFEHTHQTIGFVTNIMIWDPRALLPSLPFNDERRTFSAYKATFYDEMKGKYVDLSTGWYNRFTVDQPISIVSFGFYGPYSVDDASYTVKIKLLQDLDTASVLGETCVQNILVKVKEIFHVKFPHPIPIFPEVAYRAWFSIKGPLTCHGGSSMTTMEVCVPVSTRYQHVKFNYSVVGAHQLPEIMFEV